MWPCSVAGRMAMSSGVRMGPKRPPSSGQRPPDPRSSRPPSIGIPSSHHRRHAADLPRWLVVLAWGTVVFTSTAMLLPMPLSGGDLPMHLAVGRWMWEHGTVLRQDVFSYMSPGAPFVAHSWLSELLFYGIDQTLGAAGLVFTRFLLIGPAWVI